MSTNGPEAEPDRDAWWSRYHEHLRQSRAEGNGGKAAHTVAHERTEAELGPEPRARVVAQLKPKPLPREPFETAEERARAVREGIASLKGSKAIPP